MVNFKAFTLVMLIWTVSEYVSRKTKSILSSLLVASLIFLIGFKTNLFPETLLVDSAILPLGQAVVGFILVHIGTMISIKELKLQWKTVVVGISAVLGVTAIMLTLGNVLLDGIGYVIAAIGSITGATVSVIMVQEAAAKYSLDSVKVLPVLVAAFQGIVGFPLTAIILKKEARRLKGEYREGRLEVPGESLEKNEKKKKLFSGLPEIFSTTQGALFAVGVSVILASYIDKFTSGRINMFIAALLLGVILREVGIYKENMLNGIDAFGLMMLAIMIIIFGPLATISSEDLRTLLYPLIVAFILGVSGNIIFSSIAGKILGYSIPMSIAIGLTSLYGFPGTMILSQEAAKSVGETEEEIKAIEGGILPKMIIAGFSTVTITSVLITGILIGYFTN